MIKVEIDEGSGFCFGVVTAIHKAEEELAKGETLYCLGDIVHNSREVDRLKTMGLITINREEFKKLRNAKVLLRAHGEPPETYIIARENNIEIIDATCPVVLRLQKRIKQEFLENEHPEKQIVIYGKTGHAEVLGLVGQTDGKAIVIEKAEEAKKLDLSKSIRLFSQTTKSLDEFQEIVEYIKQNISPETTFEYYDTICRQVANRMPAQAFGELLVLVESGQTQYALAEFNYSNVYDHEKAKGTQTCYSDIFYTRRQNWLMPGSVEAIFRGPSGNNDGNANNSNWNMSKIWGPKVAGIVDHDKIIHLPTANLVEMYGMANGLPLDDPQSGFDERHPFKNRDPRFYHDIIFDGFHFVLAEDKLSDVQKPYAYCDLSTGADMRSADLGSRTGYFFQKFVPHTCNEGDREYDWGSNLHTYLPYMRLADIAMIQGNAVLSMKLERYSSAYKDSLYQSRGNVVTDKIVEAETDAQITLHQLYYKGRLNIYLCVFIPITIIVIMIVFFLYRKNKQYRGKNDLLQKNNQQLEKVNQDLSQHYACLQEEITQRDLEIENLRKELASCRIDEEQREKIRVELDEMVLRRKALVKEAFLHSPLYHHL